jgi:ethanolamine utilization protein EutA
MVKIEDIQINIDSQKQAQIYYVKVILETNGNPEAESLGEKFMLNYEKLLKEHGEEDIYDLHRYYRLITEFKPALLTILKPGKDFDMICDMAVKSFNGPLDRIRKQIEENRLTPIMKGPVMPGSSKTIDLKYLCTVCNQTFDIPPEVKEKLLDSDETQKLPIHCEKEMILKIVRTQEGEKTKDLEPRLKILPAEVLMSHVDSEEAKTEYLKLLSVGIDVGSSTSHLVFSRLTLKRELSFFNMSNRFNLHNREIIYKGNIIFTPLIDRNTIDIEAVVKFFEEEYQKAGITPEMVDTGAVIVTGETAKKQNALEIVNRLSSESGKFVSASAGPNFESVLGAMGSGIVELSKQKQNTILNVDIGGGTSNLAISSNGEILTTSCINIGGRLLGIDENFKIWRIDSPTEIVMNQLNLNYEISDIITKDDVRMIAHEYAKSLFEVMRGPATSKLAKELMMTDDLDFYIPIDEVSFSGGVAEMIYDKASEMYEDIGIYIAEEIKSLIKGLKVPLIEPENKIRATVIGAGAFSLSVSGSTCYYDENIDLPILNVPVVPANINLRQQNLKSKVKQSLKNFNLTEGEDVFALYFKDLIAQNDLEMLAKEIEKALPNSAANKKLIIIILRYDGAKMLGITIRDNTSIKQNLFCLDELELEAGDWIDIGAPLKDGVAFPVTIKSLVFNKVRKDS